MKRGFPKTLLTSFLFVSSSMTNFHLLADEPINKRFEFMHIFDIFRGEKGEKGDPAFPPAYLFAEDSSSGRYTCSSSEPYFPIFSTVTADASLDFDERVTTIQDDGMYAISAVFSPTNDPQTPSSIVIGLMVNGQIVEEQVHPIRVDSSSDQILTLQPLFIRQLYSCDDVQILLYNKNNDNAVLNFSEMSYIALNGAEDPSSPAINKKLSLIRLQ